jgi:hypothetical protein
VTGRGEQIARHLLAQREDLERFFVSLAATEWERPLTASEQPDGTDWSAGDHLARVVESEWGFLHIRQRVVAGDPNPLRLARRGNTPEERSAFLNRENQQQVEQRRGQDRDQLLEELRRVRAERSALVINLSDQELSRPVPGWPAPDPAAANILASTRHSQAHGELVRNALAASGGDPC